jgi:hypothetical protein
MKGRFFPEVNLGPVEAWPGGGNGHAVFDGPMNHAPVADNHRFVGERKGGDELK